ncbi:hypothetical protein [Victivallis vadensis]|uniref:hypothetical protein n=1 Tax=Victivallis vadensis TaxID=172901 RepID=UPI003AF86D35
MFGFGLFQGDCDAVEIGAVGFKKILFIFFKVSGEGVFEFFRKRKQPDFLFGGFFEFFG